MSEHLTAYYKTSADSFDRNRLDGDEEVASHCKWFELGHKSLEAPMLLDVGCGTGRYTYAFSKVGYVSIGVDASKAQLRHAVKKVPVICGDAEHLPIAGGTFDVVSFVMMLQQLSVNGLSVAIREAARVLKAGGLVWIKTCTHSDLAARPFSKFFPSALGVNKARYPDETKLDSALKAHDFLFSRRKTMTDSYELIGREIKRRFSEKHNTTLYLIPDNQFRAGLVRLRQEFDDDSVYKFSHRHTLLEYERS